jgi:hypothetical protein
MCGTCNMLEGNMKAFKILIGNLDKETVWKTKL